MHLKKVPCTQKVEKLKRVIAARLSIPEAQQRLFFNQVRLVNAYTLDYYGIGPNATIQLMP
ncbi:MAG: hypothetical protein LLG04_02400 [Parachlamydia sp.]|nr:hypothetical protein [Parachlamydia sp.]